MYCMFLLQDWEGPIGPTSPDQPWPKGRGVHATTCLVDPQCELAAEHQQIVVFWGEGKDAIHLPDIWVLHVASRTWKQVGKGSQCSGVCGEGGGGYRVLPDI